MVSTDPTDPNFGLETDQSSPNFGLPSEQPKQESVVGNALAGAGDVIKGFAKQFVPDLSLKNLASIAYGPVNAQIQGYNALKGVVDTAEQVRESENTAPFSRERFGAGFNVVGQLGLLALGAKAPKPLSEIAGFKPESPEVTPQTPEPTISETVPPITETIKPEEITNAVQEQSPSSVLPHPQEGVTETGGERVGVGPSVQGEEIAQTRTQAQEVGGASEIQTNVQRQDVNLGVPTREIPEGSIEEGINQEHPDVAAQIDRYSHSQEATGLTNALKHEDYGGYYDDLQRVLKRSYGDEPIPVTRVEGYEEGAHGKGVGEHISVSTFTRWGEGAAKRGAKVIKGFVKREDVVAAGNEAEGELIIKKSGLKTSPVPVAEGATTAVPEPKTEVPTETTTAEPLPQTPSEPPPVTPETPATVETPKGVQGTQAEIAKAREARGIDPYERQLRQSWGEAVDRADARLAEDPQYGENLAREISDTPRAANPEEHVALLRNWREKEAAYDRAIKSGNPDALEIARQGAEEAYDALDKSGTAGGRLLVARKMIVDEFYTPKRMKAEMEAAGMGKKLTKTEEAQVEKVHEEIQTAKSALSEKEGQLMADRGMAEKLSERIKKHNANLDRMAAEARESIIKEKGSLKWEEDFSPCVL